MKIYLAGGMRTDWQDIFINRYPEFEFFDPRKHCLELEKEYTFIDTLQIAMSNMVICYFEKSNPSGLGLAFEAGYAIGLNIPVLMIDEKEDRYAGMIRASSRFVYSTIEESLYLLDGLVKGLI